MGHDGAKLSQDGSRWSQDGSIWRQDGATLALWGASGGFGKTSGGFGGTKKKKEERLEKKEESRTKKTIYIYIYIYTNSRSTAPAAPYYIILVLHMSPSGDEKFRCQRSTIAVGSPWGGTNGVLVHLADPGIVQMKILQQLCWQCEPLRQQ